jgi:type II secretory pathway pseudopilin PulG
LARNQPSSRAIHLCHDERGDTLIEVLLTIMILGTAGIAMIGALGNTVTASAVHRKQAIAETALRSFTEAVKAEPYRSCATKTAAPGNNAYTGLPYQPPAGFVATVENVSFIAGAAWSGSCTTDPGAQLLKLQVSTTTGSVSESFEIVKRTP